MIRLLTGDCRTLLPTLAAESVHCVVTSPPYWGLRDYGLDPSVWDGEPDCQHKWEEQIIPPRHADNGAQGSTLVGSTTRQEACQRTAIRHAFCQRCSAWRGCLGLEPTPALYIQHLVGIFAMVWRVLRTDGVVWLNIGDSYSGSGVNDGTKSPGLSKAAARGNPVKRPNGQRWHSPLKPKDLCLIPFRLAIALQDAGWWVRSDIAWCKKSPMPESVQDRPTSAWEHVFLLTKSERYFYDAEAVKETAVADHASGNGFKRDYQLSRGGRGRDEQWRQEEGTAGRNLRNYWLLGPEPLSGELAGQHFASFPTALAERCIKAGCPAGGTVLDPFAGSGTTLLVADRLGRHAIGCEQNPAYVALARQRLFNDAPLLTHIEEAPPCPQP